METMTLIVIAGLPTLFLAWILWMSFRTDKFRKNLKAGDRCVVFIEEDRVFGIVKVRFNDVAWVEVNGELLKRNIEECYI
jgi:hypothetical protein